MAQAATTAKPRSDSDRTVVSLPHEAIVGIDKLIARARTQSRDVIGVEIEPKRGEIVVGLVRQAVAALDAQQSE